jgi:hypothetical protein
VKDTLLERDGALAVANNDLPGVRAALDEVQTMMADKETSLTTV